MSAVVIGPTLSPPRSAMDDLRMYAGAIVASSLVDSLLFLVNPVSFLEVLICSFLFPVLTRFYGGEEQEEERGRVLDLYGS